MPSTTTTSGNGIVTATPAEAEALARLDRVTREAALLAGREEVRVLVEAYYDLQKSRIQMGNREGAFTRREETPELIAFFSEQYGTIEGQMRAVLTKWAKNSPHAAWPLSQKGIGPVLAAGLVAHIDITRAPTVGHIWSFAGLNPNAVWKKGERRPWNASLKTLCWKIGDSFVKVSGREGAYYGQLYRERKAFELDRDASGGNAANSAKTLATREIKDKDLRALYESGHFPAGRLDLMARRWTVKLFLAHLHEVWYRMEYDKDPPLPYPIAHGQHVHVIPVPPAADDADLDVE